MLRALKYSLTGSVANAGTDANVYVTLIGTYTYSTVDLNATVAALHRGAFGDLEWVEERSLADGATAFADLDKGRTAAAKILLRP